MSELFGLAYERGEILKRVGLIEQLGGVRLSELADGIGRCVRVAELRTAAGLDVTVLIDRGLDIYDANYKGIPLAWLSPTGPTHPAYFESPGLGWRRGFFGGLMLTCGMTTIGAPSIDQGEVLGLHGRVSNLPARQVHYGGTWDGDEYVAYIEGEVRETVVFGENLLMHRRIEARLGETKLAIYDRVKNEGFQRTPHMLLYHVNAGFPVVDDGSRLVAPTRSVTPRDRDAEVGLGEYSHFSGPIPGYREQVFFHDMAATPEGYVKAAIVNPAFDGGRGFGFYVRYRQRELPCFNQWKMMGESIYSVGMEPATNPVEGRARARELGALQFLDPGEERQYHLEFGVVTSQAEIAALEREALGLAGSQSVMANSPVG